ncbi:TnsD family Tn7-like transposition protein [Aquincola tertiaricarbonis]|uniref:TnsD family Tn7-like transposition protein n=1 Tax=Aquincola tertiaricarbonis TaxID=391953 RepID=UPI0018DC800E|nr:TnsD family Tn7-like transposition protein [Aquincola tertiaricarbonis]
MAPENHLFSSEGLRFLANLPILERDETLYSWAGTVHVFNPTPDARETSRRLYGEPFAALMHDFPSHLSALRRNVGDQLAAPSVLALRHSLLGYFLPARPRESSAQVLCAAEGGAVSSLKFQLGIAASRVGGHHPLKGCRRCFEDQLTRHGRAYWRVSHQLPSVVCCVEHDKMLEIAWDPTTPVHRRGWILPLGGLAREWRLYPPVSEVQFQRLKRLANFSMRWAQLQPSSFVAERLALVYRAVLREQALLTPRGSLRLAEIVRLVRQHFQGFERFPELRAIRSSDASWSTLIGAATRRAPRPCHPLKHLLLISTLFSTWAEFVAAYEAEPIEEAEPAPESVYLPEAEAARSGFVELVGRQGLSISAAGRHVGITATTAVRWAKLLGLGYTARTKTYTQERLERARGLLRQGAPKAQVGELLGLSVGSVDRLISSEPALASEWRAARHERAREVNRKQFAKALATMPGRPLKEIRAIPGCGYAWLFRHDRQWLMESLPFLNYATGRREAARHPTAGHDRIPPAVA